MNERLMQVTSKFRKYSVKARPQYVRLYLIFEQSLGLMGGVKSTDKLRSRLPNNTLKVFTLFVCLTPNLHDLFFFLSIYAVIFLLFKFRGTSRATLTIITLSKFNLKFQFTNWLN